MAGNRQIPTLRDLAFNGLVKQGLFSAEFELTPLPGVKDPETDELVYLPLEHQQECISEIVVQMAAEKLLPKLLKAIIDDDRKTVKEMLDAVPQLLLLIPSQDCVIESQYTWQKFYAEGALKMAVKQKQIKMIELLVPYYDKLPQTEDVINAKTEALSAWKFYETKKTANDEEIVIPREYELLAESLIGFFREETFPNGIPGENNIPLNIELSDSTELALSSLLNILVPKKAAKLDECIDVELLLFALYKSYVKNFSSFNNNWNQLDALCIRVMGLIQSALIPETGEIFCESLDDVVTAMNRGKELEISPKASAHKLKGDKEFYRENRDSRAGLGFEFLCGIFGRRRLRLFAFTARGQVIEHGTAFGKTMSNKNNKFSEYYAAVAATARPTRCSK